jgi:hypothetical protein
MIHTGKTIARCSNKLGSIFALSDDALVEVINGFFEPHADDKERREAWRLKVRGLD